MKKITVYFSLLLLIVLHLSCSNRSVLTENINTEKEWNKVDSILKLISEPVIPEEEYYLNDFGGKGDGIFEVRWSVYCSDACIHIDLKVKNLKCYSFSTDNSLGDLILTTYCLMKVTHKLASYFLFKARNRFWKWRSSVSIYHPLLKAVSKV